MWYNVKVLGQKGIVTLRTWAEDAAQAVENVCYLFPFSQGFRVVDCVAV